MTDPAQFEQEVREHLAAMLNRPMTADEVALLERALADRRNAVELVAAAALTH
jgi:hypothetical protein